MALCLEQLDRPINHVEEGNDDDDEGSNSQHRDVGNESKTSFSKSTPHHLPHLTQPLAEVEGLRPN